MNNKETRLNHIINIYTAFCINSEKASIYIYTYICEDKIAKIDVKIAISLKFSAQIFRISVYMQGCIIFNAYNKLFEEI